MISRAENIDNILALLTIIVTVATFFISWNKDREFVRRGQADQVRIAAAASISKLGRWKEISLTLFDEVQSSFVEASEIVVKESGKFNIVGARDYLWKAISRARIDTKRHIINENIENAYTNLVAYYPKSRAYFHDVIDSLSRAEDAMFKKLRETSQDDVLSFFGKSDGYDNSAMGNKLRAGAVEIKEAYMSEIDSIISKAVARLNSVIDLDDTALILHRQDLFDNRSDKAAVPIPR